MSLANYSDLQSALADWLVRSDLTSRIVDFIALSEAVMAYGFGKPGDPTYCAPLRVAAMETKISTTTTSGTNTVALPSDYLAMRGEPYLDGSPTQPLRYSSPSQVYEMWTEGTTEKPRFYTIKSTNLVLSPTPDSAYNLYYWYYAKVPALSDSNTTNWILTNVPGLYLYGSLLQAAPYIGDDQNAQLWQAAYTGLVNSLQAQDEDAQHSGGPLQMRSRTGNP